MFAFGAPLVRMPGNPSASRQNEAVDAPCAAVADAAMRFEAVPPTLPSPEKPTICDSRSGV